MGRYLHCFLFVLSYFLFLNDIISQPGYWMLKGGGATIDEGIDICIDNNGNTFTTGYFSGLAKFGNFSLSSSGTTDIFIVKTNSSGVVQWARCRWQRAGQRAIHKSG